jgi:hypothetical protein
VGIQCHKNYIVPQKLYQRGGAAASGPRVRAVVGARRRGEACAGGRGGARQAGGRGVHGEAAAQGGDAVASGRRRADREGVERKNEKEERGSRLFPFFAECP